MKHFLIFFLMIFVSPNGTHAQWDIILRPSLTPPIFQNAMWSPNLPINNSQISSSESEKTQKNISENTENVCIKNPKMTFFMYHYIRYAESNASSVLRELSVPPETFRSHMQAVSNLAKNKKITLMTGKNFVKSMKTNCFPGNNVWIFFADDGWEDNFYRLAPIAEEFQIPFVFGIISEKINQRNFVTDTQVKTLSENPLFTIASHTKTHSALNYGPIPKAKSEICDSKKQLENLTKKPIDILLYPYGIIGKNTEKFARQCGYSLGFSTKAQDTFSWEKRNFFTTGRIHISPNTPASFFHSLAEK